MSTLLPRGDILPRPVWTNIPTPGSPSVPNLVSTAFANTAGKSASAWPPPSSSVTGWAAYAPTVAIARAGEPGSQTGVGGGAGGAFFARPGGSVAVGDGDGVVQTSWVSLSASISLNHENVSSSAE